MIMTENRGSAFTREMDPINFESKEIYELNDSSRDINEAKSNEHKNHKVIDDLPLNNVDETVDSPRKEGENGLLHKQEDSEHECLVTVEERTIYNQQKSGDPSTPCNDSSYPFKAEANEFADKNVSEVCYKEMDQHTVKDICVDEGNSEKGIVLIECNDKDKAIDKPFDKDYIPLVEQELKDSGLDSHLDTISVNDSSNPGPVGKKIPVDDIGAESLIGSALKSFDVEENMTKQRPPQSLAIALGKEDSLQQETGISKSEVVKEPANAASGASDSQIQSNNRARISTGSDVRMQKDDGGETSFSAASLINYEPVPFSGSISHRSDSSTTSARSFAFPVLQSEWNSSPVRMAKAERRHLKKQRWRSGLCCCRF